jgi:GAF domain-containing protein
MIASMRVEAGRAVFERQLAEALDMADSEQQVSHVAAQAMSEVAPQYPMELLIADSSRAHMERAAEHPGAGAPGCQVGSPYECVAVRRGTLVTFPDSEALNACRHLRGRDCGPTSAVCVPVTFMGRAIGVLHTTAPVTSPLPPEQTQQLGTLGTQIGMRIGTVRAFEKSQIQASTDGLTGLPNGRTLEQQLRLLAAGEQAFAIVTCDLDHFKLLNDGHGHATGDATLRIFADCCGIRCAIRTWRAAGAARSSRSYCRRRAVSVGAGAIHGLHRGDATPCCTSAPSLPYWPSSRSTSACGRRAW